MLIIATWTAIGVDDLSFSTYLLAEVCFRAPVLRLELPLFGTVRPRTRTQLGLRIPPHADSHLLLLFIRPKVTVFIVCSWTVFNCNLLLWTSGLLPCPLRITILLDFAIQMVIVISWPRSHLCLQLTMLTNRHLL